MNNQDLHRYDDIINLPHHVSITRPHMDRLNRAAQFSPFAALTGYEEAIEETARLTDTKMELSEDKRARLDERMQILMERLDEKPKVVITYFKPDKIKEGGVYETISGEVGKIDEFAQLIIFTDGRKVSVENIYDIEGEIYRFLDSSVR